MPVSSFFVLSVNQTPCTKPLPVHSPCFECPRRISTTLASDGFCRNYTATLRVETASWRFAFFVALLPESEVADARRFWPVILSDQYTAWSVTCQLWSDFVHWLTVIFDSGTSSRITMQNMHHAESSCCMQLSRITASLANDAIVHYCNENRGQGYHQWNI